MEEFNEDKFFNFTRKIYNIGGINTYIALILFSMLLSFFIYAHLLFNVKNSLSMVWILMVLLLLHGLTIRKKSIWSGDNQDKNLYNLSAFLKTGYISNNSEFQLTLTTWHKKAKRYYGRRKSLSIIKFVGIFLFLLFFYILVYLHFFFKIQELQLTITVFNSLIICSFLKLSQEEVYLKRFHGSVKKIIKLEVKNLDKIMRETTRAIKEDKTYLTKVDFEKLISDLHQLFYFDQFDSLKGYKFDLYKIYRLYCSKFKRDFNIIEIIDSYIKCLEYVLIYPNMEQVPTKIALDSLDSIRSLKREFNDELKSRKYSPLMRFIKRENTETSEEQSMINLIFNRNLWKNFIRKNLKTVEGDFWDFKQTLNLWQTKDKKTMTKSKLKLCRQVCSYANAKGGVIIIGVTDKVPRKIIGLEDVENKKKNLHQVIHEYVTKFKPFFEVIDVNFFEDNTIRTCLIIVIQQTKNVKQVYNKRDGAIYFSIREAAGTIKNLSPDEVELLKEEKKSVNKNNYYFIKALIN